MHKPHQSPNLGQMAGPFESAEAKKDGLHGHGACANESKTKKKKRVGAKVDKKLK